MSEAQPPEIAVILPCYNEAAAIAGVVADFRTALPEARIYVFDNASTDDTARIAAAAGAIVRCEPLRGKGNVVARAFADVDADVYVMADGDGTYDAGAARGMVDALWRERLDMVVGVRAAAQEGAYRAGHALGNRAFSVIFRRFFRSNFTDILSGYRVFSRRFVKSFPSRAAGFEIELEMSAHAALLRLPCREIETAYGARVEGGASKLDTWRDGLRIFRRMLKFLRLHRPRLVYGLLGALSGLFGIAVLLPIIVTYLDTGLVPRFPTLIVAIGILIGALLLFLAGAILDAQAQHFAETKRLAYLRAPAPGARDAA